MTIIPDSIEPYIGYKALRIDHNGQLCSPSYAVAWPVGTKMTATCSQETLGWRLKEGPDIYTMPYSTVSGNIHARHQMEQALRYQQFFAVYSTGAPSAFVNPVDPWDCPPKPEEPAPEGFHWAWEMGPHLPGDEYCSCGIYAVNNVSGTFGYLKPDCVLVKVAMWGQVTLGFDGARGQFAYPQLLYVPDHLKEKAVTVAATYEIPWEKAPTAINRRQVGQAAQTNPNVSDLIKKQEAASAALFFGILGMAFSLAGLAIRLFTPNTKAQLLMTFFLVVCVILTIMASRDARK